MPKACRSGYITRSGYMRKAHSRSSYKRSDGTKVRGSYVSRTKVGKACTPDKGKKGKTSKSRRILPKPGKEISLSRYGYSTDKSSVLRHNALRSATKDFKPLKVY